MTVIEQVTSFPPVAIRQCGVRAAALDSLRWNVSYALVKALIAESAWLASEGTCLAIELGAEIGGLAPAEQGLRPVLVGLRRALHAGRIPAAREWDARVAAALSDELGGRVAEWIDRAVKNADRRVRLPGLIAEETPAKEAELRGVAADPAFRRALTLAGPELAVELDKWLADPARRPKPQKLLRLAKYVARAATKTSPYSTFTSMGLAVWGEQEEPGETEPVTVIEVDWSPSTPPDLVRLNPSARIREDRIEFIGPPPAESLVSLGLTEAVRACLRFTEAGDWVASSGFAVALDAEPRAAAGFVATLLKAGLLQAHPRALPAPIRSELSRAERSADPGSYRRDLARLGAVTGGLTVHEVAISPMPVAALDPARWRARIDDLDTVRRWLAVFDAKAPMRLAVADYLIRCYGPDPAVDFLTLHRHVQQELAGTGPSGAELRAFLGSSARWTQPLAASAVSRVRELDTIRAAARILALADELDGTCEVPTESLAEQLRDWPEWIAIPTSSACYVQECPDERVVLNVVHGGHGRALRRLDHLIERGGGTAEPYLPEDPDGAVYAELSGTLGSVLNDRPPSTHYEIDYPHSPGVRPPERRLPLTDLVVTLSPGSGLPELRSRRLGMRVIPLHLGMAAEFKLPPAARFIERVFGPGYLSHPSSPPLVRMGNVPTGVTRYPRVVAGRVVVQRRRWLAPATTLPVRAKGEDDAGFLTRLVGWAAEHGIPDRSFVRAWPEQTGSAGQDKARKPLYLDLSNLFLVKVFERQARGCAFALFEEALPDPGGVAGRVSEYLIEVAGR